jgi:hypothetical protein
MERQYKMQQSNQAHSSPPPGGISLNQAITGEEDPSVADRNGPPPPANTRITDRSKYSADQEVADTTDTVEEERGSPQTKQDQQYSPSINSANSNLYDGRYTEIVLSLNKDDLVNIDGDTFTFCWNHKFLSNFKDDFNMELKYASLPKNLSHILVRYTDLEENQKSNPNKSKVYNALGKNYHAKLIPCHSSEEHTTYQAIQSSQPSQQTISTLPSTLTFQMIAPMSQKLDLNVIAVQKIIKTEKIIQVLTKVPHNLTEDDQLTLEFPQQHVCYRITNLEIQSDRQISFNSPFNGYFSSDFRLIRNSWDIDLTLICRYRVK